MWRLSLKDRWRLYRRWLVDVAEEYRRTISLFQEQFEVGARKLKDIKNMEDFEILKKADVVGMTTTGKQKKLAQSSVWCLVRAWPVTQAFRVGKIARQAYKESARGPGLLLQYIRILGTSVVVMFRSLGFAYWYNKIFF